MQKRNGKRLVSWICMIAFLAVQILPLNKVRADSVAMQPGAKVVLTMGADLTPDQQAYIMQYFGVSQDQVSILYITNADERSHLGGLISDEQIGTHTLSCALLRPTTSGGIQVKTANMNYVTSNMIASTLTTSGVYNCEVLTAAPFLVSGTGALTGAMMGYEEAIGIELDAEKMALANEELVITGQIADTVGQDQATLVVNDIKINIIRNQIVEQPQVNEVVDNVISTTEAAAEQAAAEKGEPAPQKLGQEEHEKLYGLGYKFGQMRYNYSDMQPTLERVTHNVAKSSGIKDPIEDTFTTIGEDSGLSVDSILLNTDDNVLGEDANINATSYSAVGDHEAEPIEVFSGDVQIETAGGVKADGFISRTNVISYRDLNGAYALIDLNGNILTESVYKNEFSGSYGNVRGELYGSDEDNKGLLGQDGKILVPFVYPIVETLSEKWAYGVRLKSTDGEDFDYYSGSEHYIISQADIYYLDGSATALASLTRDQFRRAQGMGDYLNIRDASGNTTTYDSSMNPVRQAEDVSDFGPYDENNGLSELLSQKTGYTVFSFRGNYGKVRDRNSQMTGVIDRYGNLIIPLNFSDLVYYDDNSLLAGGYFCAKQDGILKYVTAGGTVTGDYSYPEDQVRNNGMSGLVKKDDGSWIILSGDGRETVVGNEYSRMECIRESRGMLYSAFDGKAWDLFDWHGNLLLSGSKGYSVSNNGNYLISRDGYSSSTLYCLNGASPVKLSESAGGASELDTSETEAKSLVPYTADPVVKELCEIPDLRFLGNSDVLYDNSDGKALYSLDGKQLSSNEYSSLSYEDGWVVCYKEVESLAGRKIGLLSTTGAVAVPCEHDVMDVMNEHWAAGYDLSPTATKEDFDYSLSGSDDTIYCYIDRATVYHLSDAEVLSVQLTRDQAEDLTAEEDYLNIRDSNTGVTTTYDGSFTAVASAGNTSDFTGLSKTSYINKMVADKTGLTIYNRSFPDGYSKVGDYSGEKTLYGVADVSGNMIIPAEYENVITHNAYDGKSRVWAEGYFCVEKDSLFGYVTNGNAVTYPLQYQEEQFQNFGIAGKYKISEEKCRIIAADGKESGDYKYATHFGNGLLWEVTYEDGHRELVDWHGNTLFSEYREVKASNDCRYIIVKDKEGVCRLYGVDGAVLPGDEQSEVPSEETEIVPGSDTEEIPAAEPEQTPDSQASAIPAAAEEEDPAELIRTADSLILSDYAANHEKAIELAEKAKSLLEEQNPDAAALLSSALTLLEFGIGDAGSVDTLFTSVLEILE